MPVSTTTRGRPYVSRSRHRPYRLLQDGKHRRPEVGFRRSMAGLRYPLSTLRFAPRGSPRMTRGRCGSLHLHRKSHGRFSGQVVRFIGTSKNSGGCFGIQGLSPIS